MSERLKGLRSLFYRRKDEQESHPQTEWLPFPVRSILKTSARNADAILDRFGKGMDRETKSFLHIALQESFFRIEFKKGQEGEGEEFPKPIFSQVMNNLTNKRRLARDRLINGFEINDPILDKKIGSFSRQARLAADIIIGLVAYHVLEDLPPLNTKTIKKATKKAF